VHAITHALYKDSPVFSTRYELQEMKTVHHAVFVFDLGHLGNAMRISLEVAQLTGQSYSGPLCRTTKDRSNRGS
jgi:hypothetical protein